jgi:hypothetical protein
MCHVGCKQISRKKYNERNSLAPWLTILFADDTCIIIYHPDSNYFQNSINDVFADLNNWFKANKLTSNFDKTNFMKFTTNNKTIHYQ